MEINVKEKAHIGQRLEVAQNVPVTFYHSENLSFVHMISVLFSTVCLI